MAQCGPSEYQPNRPKADTLTPSPSISSPQNPLIRHVVKLRDNRYRQREGVVLVDGTREIARAIQGGLRLQSLLITGAEGGRQRQLTGDQDELLGQLIAQAGNLTVTVTDELMSKIAYGGNPRGAVALFERPRPLPLEQFKLPEIPLVLILVGVEKPGNAGAIFRSADAVGVDAVVLCETGCDLFNPNLIRGSLGTVFTTPTAEASESETIDWIRKHGLTCVSTVVGAPLSFWDADYRAPTAIVVGSEASGLGSRWGALPTESVSAESSCGADGPHPVAVSIPMRGAADSLNVSVAAAVLLFEAGRQRRSLRG